MTEPVTTLDERFSQPGTAATPWEQTRRSLEAAQLFWITTGRGPTLGEPATPAKVLAFGQGTFTHTSHRFT